eukprot:545048-Rhodomonas_salina.1
MRIDQGWAKRITVMYQLTPAQYIQQIRKHRWGDLLTIQAFCEAISAEVTVLDPSNEAPTIVRALGMER